MIKYCKSGNILDPKPADCLDTFNANRCGKYCSICKPLVRACREARWRKEHKAKTKAYLAEYKARNYGRKPATKNVVIPRQVKTILTIRQLMRIPGEQLLKMDFYKTDVRDVFK